MIIKPNYKGKGLFQRKQNTMSVKPNYKKFVIFFKEKKIKLHAGGFVRLPPS